MGRRWAEEHLRRNRIGARDAVRRRSRWRRARIAAGRCADLHLYGFTGIAAHDPEHVQDRGRVPALRLPRFRTYPGLARPLHLWRPPGRDGRTPDGLCHAGRRLRAGGDGLGRCGTPGHAQVTRPVRQLLRRLPHLARDPEDRETRQRGSRSAHRSKGPGRVPRPRPEPDEPRGARYG